MALNPTNPLRCRLALDRNTAGAQKTEYSVLAPAVFQPRGDTITEAEKALLDELHLRKIDLADAMFVVDPGGYIGESTTREIGYARSTGKPIFRLSVVRDRYTERR